MADAGLRLVVEGEKEFKAALSQCDAAVKENQKSLKLLSEEYKLNQTGMKDAASGFGSMADAAAILTEKGKVLAESVAAQTEKVGLLDQRVKEASEAYGEHDKRTEALRSQLLDASTALAKLTNEQEKNRQAILDAQNSTQEYDDAVKTLEAQLAANEAEMKTLRSAYGDLEKSSEELREENGRLGKSDDDLKLKTENLEQKNKNLTDQNAKLSDSIAKQKDVVDKLAKAQETAAARYGEGSEKAEAYRKKLAEATTQLDAMERELKENETAIKNNNAELEKGGDAGKSMKDVLGEIENLTGVKIPSGIEKMIGGMDAGAVAAGGILAMLTQIAEKVWDTWQESLSYSQDLTTKAAELDLGVEEYQALEYVASKAGISMSVFDSALSKITMKAGAAVTSSEEYTEKIEEQKAALTEQISEQERAVDTAKKSAEEAADAYEEARDRYTSALREMTALSSNPDVIADAVKPWKESYEAAEKARDASAKAYAESEENLDDLRQSLAELDTAQDTSMKYWDDLGISIYDTNGKIKSSYDLLMELIDAYGELEPGIERSAAMQEIFGKSYKTLNPLIETGTGYMRDWIDEAYEMGAVLDEGTVATNNFAKAQQDAWGKQAQQTLRKAADEFAYSSNVIEGSINAITTAFEGFDRIWQSISGKSIGKTAWENTGIGGFFKGIQDVGDWIADLFGIGGTSTRTSSGGISHGGSGGRYASGTMYAPGGYSLVGERGPEIVELPRGSKVFPNGEIPTGLGGTTVNEVNTYNVTIDASRVQEFEDIVRIAQSARVGMRRG